MSLVRSSIVFGLNKKTYVQLWYSEVKTITSISFRIPSITNNF